MTRQQAARDMHRAGTGETKTASYPRGAAEKVAGKAAGERRAKGDGQNSREADQVARRIEFCAAHPEVSVEYRRETSRWEAAWPAGNGTETVSDHELWRVLDELERRLGQTRPRDGGTLPARRGSRHDG